jgi:hypothetical protein
MSEILEPSPLLVEYYQSAKHFEMGEFLLSKVGDGEWLYIQSNLDQNIFLLRRLDDLGLLPVVGRVCDCGIGLGTALFDIYLQSKDLCKDYSFVGIEKQTRYLDYIVDNLLDFWNGDLEVIDGDLMDQDYGGFDIIYCYTPFRDILKLRLFYLKLISEMSIGSILVENKNFGLGEGGILSSISDDIICIDLDGVVVFQKI